jgi:hypothetical protein
LPASFTLYCRNCDTRHTPRAVSTIVGIGSAIVAGSKSLKWTEQISAADGHYRDRCCPRSLSDLGNRSEPSGRASQKMRDIEEHRFYVTINRAFLGRYPGGRSRLFLSPTGS